MSNKEFDREVLCDQNCNECDILRSANSNMVSAILNTIYSKCEDDGGPDITKIVNSFCPNLTVCPDCHVDDFCHYNTDNDERCTSLKAAFRYLEENKDRPLSLVEELTEITEQIMSLNKRLGRIKQMLTAKENRDEN